ncbi:MAG: diadenylate cyclase CdaA, partial [Polyangiales bacterium]
MIDELVVNVQTFFAREPLAVIRDVVDITLVATVLYWILALIRGTRAMQMAIGLAAVFIVHQAARELGFVTVWEILDTLLTYIVLIIVILFQNDIRRALMRVGRRPFLKSQRTARETHVIEEVIKAATALAQKRIGALIVFERDAMLDEFIEPGTELDSGVTKELLYSIFIPSFENPMHDGAVIIREGRVWQAGAFLSLSASPQLDRSLGARHRAAIGISEETDAVVVVVSEERGSTSLCFNGNIVRNLDEKSLREALIGLFYKKRKHKQKKKATAAARAGGGEGRVQGLLHRDSLRPGHQPLHRREGGGDFMTKRRSPVLRFVREVFTHNIGLKLFALAAAIGLFSIVHGAEDDERSYFVEVAPQLPPPSSGRMLVSELPDKVKVTLRGSRSLVSSVTAEDLGPVTIDLRNTNRSYYYFDPDSFELPASVQLAQLAPASIPLTWAKRVERRIPVEVRIVGIPGPALEARPVRVDPATVPIAGPEMEIEPLEVLETERIDVRGLD